MPMPQNPVQPLLGRLAPELVTFASPHFVLQEELDKLLRIRGAGAPEAVVLYCVRSLEVLTAKALEIVGLPPSPNSYANLDLIQQYNLMPTPARSCAHALRRSGNDVRHIRRRLAPIDEPLALAFMESLLDWFFRRFPYGRQLPHLTHDQEPLGLVVDAELSALVLALDANQIDDLKRAAHGNDTAVSQWLRTPALAAMLAETLLERQEREQARAVLEAALQNDPEDLRLQQLMGLYWSRSGNLDAACACLEALYARYREDDETAGIMAGVYKRRWRADPNQAQWLEQAHAAYRHAWKAGKQTNAYLGINAATTALWLGRPEEARRRAAEVRELLHQRAQVLARHRNSAGLLFNYWDQVSLAEAELVLGSVAEAERLYGEAFHRHAGQRDSIAVTQQQAQEILKALNSCKAKCP
jgi:tetratricopeptide (TPR) repeat protein